jgi:hypothetical protein
MLSALNEFALLISIAVISPKGTKKSLLFKLASCSKSGFDDLRVPWFLEPGTEVSRDLLA